ncbi:AzlD domain-containing protein [Enterobacter sp. ENT03]|uniref:AzlD domain-containing protein n=1 Tax=Enterobacter sp. ENT03 TaxID=2854780 RepID=UPI001C43C867|nr:AzlD domain-containing protein [Enterobacter sp. ENT03]MBV7403255.1 AzlD domain-containing protein [Enterobacter sp. ENT03]
MSSTMIAVGIAVLALGTYLIRFAGYRLGTRLALSERTQTLLSDAAILLLLAVAAISTLYEAQEFAGVARVAGVLFALFLCWRKAPLVLTIIGAAVMTAGLRYIGLA